MSIELTAIMPCMNILSVLLFSNKATDECKICIGALEAWTLLLFTSILSPFLIWLSLFTVNIGST